MGLGGDTAPRWPLRAATVVLGVAAAVGVGASLFGLARNSFWLDELFTVWVIGDEHRFAPFFARVLADVHPPLYYLLVFGWAQLFGSGEVALRSFSLLASIGALALFFVGTRRVFGLPARLFAVALASVSTFWMFQAHNARSYGLIELGSAAVLAAALWLIDRERRGLPSTAALVALAAAMLATAAIHFYGVFVADATCVVLFVVLPRRRITVAALALTLTLAVFAYVHFVVTPNTVFSTTQTWIGSGARYYAAQTLWAWRATLVPSARNLVIVVAVFAFVRRDRAVRSAAATGGLLCCAVPLLVIAGGIASSVLVSPNFTDRNILVASPFAWGVAAFVADAALRRRGGSWFVLAVAAATLTLMGAARYHLANHNEPFRASAAWISAQSGCRGATIPVAVNRLQAVRGDWGDRIARAAYGYYLPPDITTRPVFIEDLRAGAAPPASGCGVVLWQIHYSVEGPNVAALHRRLAATLGRPVTLHVFAAGRGGTALVYTASPSRLTNGPPPPLPRRRGR